MDKQEIMQIVKEVMLSSIVENGTFRRDVYSLIWSKLHEARIPEKDLGIATEMIVVTFAELVTRIEYMFSKE